MPVKRLAIVVFVAGLSGWLYSVVLKQAFGYSFLLLPPKLIHGLTGLGGVGLLKLYYQLLDVAITSVFWVPFAFLIVVRARTNWFLISSTVSVGLVLHTIATTLVLASELPEDFSYVRQLALTTARFLVVIPAITYVVLRMLPNKSLERSRER